MNFFEQVYRVVRMVPYGRVATYGQIAAILSSPRAARMVGTALRHTPDGSDVPWHRVINSRGVISIENMEYPAEEQANRLLAEGIAVTKENDRFMVDLTRYLWQPTASPEVLSKDGRD